jgi:IclR family transcriptional regulator, KDG regulon repressor
LSLTNRKGSATIETVLQHTNSGSNNSTLPYKPTTTVLKAFGVLEFISNNQPVKPAVIARRLNLTRTNVHRLLSTLIEIGYVTRDENHGYRLTFKVFKLGSRVPLSQDLREVAKPVMEQLMRLANENVYLTVLYGHIVIGIEEVKGNNPLSLNPDVTYSYPIHTCASGKCFLAHMDTGRRDDLLRETGLARRTEYTITEQARMEDELTRVRRQGYATELREFSDDLNSYAAPIFDYRGQVVATISISGPAVRASRERLDSLAGNLIEASQAISLKLGRVEGYEGYTHSRPSVDPVAVETEGSV